MVVIGLLYRPPKTKSSQQDITITQKLKMLDPIGLFLFVPAMVCLILALQLSGGNNSWSSPQVIALLTLFGVFIISFIAVQIWLQEGATLPPRIAKKRTVAFAAFYAMCLDGAYYTLTYYVRAARLTFLSTASRPVLVPHLVPSHPRHHRRLIRNSPAPAHPRCFHNNDPSWRHRFNIWLPHPLHRRRNCPHNHRLRPAYDPRRPCRARKVDRLSGPRWHRSRPRYAAGCHSRAKRAEPGGHANRNRRHCLLPDARPRHYGFGRAERVRPEAGGGAGSQRAGCQYQLYSCLWGYECYEGGKAG